MNIISQSYHTNVIFEYKTYDMQYYVLSFILIKKNRDAKMNQQINKAYTSTTHVNQLCMQITHTCKSFMHANHP